VRYDPWNILRRLTDSYIRAYCVFEADLSQPRPALPPNPDLVVRLFRGDEQLQSATEALIPAGLTAEDVSARMHKGDLVAVGFVNGTPAAYTWTRFGSTLAKEIELVIRPRNHEAIQYDSLVLKPFRRHRLQFAVAAPVLDYLQQAGCTGTLSWVNLLNRPSYKNQCKWGKKRIMTVISLRLPGMKHRWNTALGARMASLFTKPGLGRLVESDTGQVLRGVAEGPARRTGNLQRPRSKPVPNSAGMQLADFIAPKPCRACWPF